MFPVAPLPTNTTCNLYGWGQQTAFPQSVSVSIYDSEFCNPDLPQVWCSTFVSTLHQTCYAVLGSPVLCDDNSRFSGFMTSDGCSEIRGQGQISYHSVLTHRLWLEEVFNSEIVSSSNFVANVMELLDVNIIGTARFRCIGTIISERHLLTTASCVSIPTGSVQGIGVEADWAERGFMTVQAEEIFIHPDFIETQTRIANVAVIKVSEFNFAKRFKKVFKFVPRITGVSVLVHLRDFSVRFRHQTELTHTSAKLSATETQGELNVIML